VAAVARRLLLPQEHGTYGELLFPLVSALLLTTSGRASWGLVGLALGGFLAHEGFSVLVGTRGTRAQRRARPEAWRSVATFGTLAWRECDLGSLHSATTRDDGADAGGRAVSGRGSHRLGGPASER